MQGSKYSDEQREQALAMFAGGFTTAKIAKILKIPSSTIADWRARRFETVDEDTIAVRNCEKRRMINRAWKIVGKTLASIEKTVSAATEAESTMMKAVKQLAKAGAIESETEKQLCKIAVEQRAVSLAEMTRAMSEVYKIHNELDDRMNAVARTDDAQSIAVTMKVVSNEA